MTNTAFGKSKAFTIFSWIRVSFAKFIPVIAVILVNILLVISLYRARSEIEHETDTANLQYKISIMLIGISIAFLLSHIPDCFVQNGVYRSLFGRCSTFKRSYYIFRLVSNLLEVVSSSANFLIYCVSIEQFLRSLKLLCSIRKKKKVGIQISVIKK